MSNYNACVHWQRNKDMFPSNAYSRSHKWIFDGGTEVLASASPHIVPAPWSDSNYVDPEQALVASLASCHMLFFLSIASERSFQIDSYTDEAVGTLARDSEGKISMTEVTLRPKVKFSGENLPDKDDIDAIHHSAHEQCFIANSVKSTIKIEPR